MTRIFRFKISVIFFVAKIYRHIEHDLLEHKKNQNKQIFSFEIADCDRFNCVVHGLKPNFTLFNRMPGNLCVLYKFTFKCLAIGQSSSRNW